MSEETNRFAPALYRREGTEDARRRQIVEVLQAALDAVDPAEAVRRYLSCRGHVLIVGERRYDLAQFARVFVVGAGKASAPMAQAVEDILGDRIVAGHVNVKYEHVAPTRIVQVHEAGHPIPDEAGVAGAEQIVDLLQEAGEDDLVLCLISGGGSALMTLPVEGVTLAEMQELTDALLRRGATINEINTIRKHLDRLKGGNLARLAHPAQVISLILSDVVGNPLDVIASGPTVPDTSTYVDAWNLLERYGLVDDAPESIVAHMRRGVEGEIGDTPKAGDPIFENTQNVVVASNDIAAAAAERAARELGYHTLVLSTYIEGEAREVAKVFAALAKETLASDRPVPRPACLIAGGETTVTIRGEGKGGRNQEMALMAAMCLRDLDDVAVVCLATDGNDGPTDAAGALADGSTVARAQALGLDAWEHLQNNDSYPFFAALDDLLLTGPTNTNVNDLTFVFAW
ncbi:MAG TPA: glycerate kinase [Chloroflexi bacterium]|nr:glycerate kinase [Chloroflexota bacterium]